VRVIRRYQQVTVSLCGGHRKSLMSDHKREQDRALSSEDEHEVLSVPHLFSDGQGLTNPYGFAGTRGRGHDFLTLGKP